MTLEADPAGTRVGPDRSAAGGVTQAARRRLLRGGLGTAPVLLSLASSPVGATLCTTGSAFTSLHPSGRQPTVSCGGFSPTTWASSSSSYPSGTGQGNKFNAYFSPDVPSMTNIQLKDLFALTSLTTQQKVAQYCAAAYLNALTGKVPASILSDALAKTIWSSYMGPNGNYQPSSGPALNGTQIIDWITSTFA
jgi:hypothetical protein